MVIAIETDGVTIFFACVVIASFPWKQSPQHCKLEEPIMILQLFFVFAKEEESLRDEFALTKGKRITYQDTMMILYLLCIILFH